MKTLMLLMTMLAGITPLSAETLTSEPFGVVTVYRQDAAAAAARTGEVVLFLSGDGGWNLGVITMARRLADQGATVAGIDIRHYLARLEQTDSACVSPADDLTQLGRKLQADTKGRPAAAPILVGYSSGATLVYAALVQANAGAFKGALSLGFCPDLDLKKPLCQGAGIGFTPRQDAKGVFKGVNFLPAKSLSGRWISLQGQLDQVCTAAPTIKFVAQVPGAELVLLPKVGHGYSVEHNWVPQYLKAFRDIAGR